METISLLWNTIIVNPMTNGLLLLYVILFSSFGLAIVGFTVAVRLITFPLHRRQVRQTQKMAGLQPLMREIQERYKNEPQRRSQETMRLYREMGINPIGCLGPFAIQLPIWIGLYWTIINVLPFSPDNLASLAGRIYSWLPVLHGAVPVDRTFLGLDLALSAQAPSAGVFYLALVGMSGLSMWVLQKMTLQPTADPRQQSSQRMMLWMMPIFFVVLSYTFPSGLVLYWVVSNIIGIVMQYFIAGWGGLRSARGPVLAPTLATASPSKELVRHGEREREGAGDGAGEGAGEPDQDRQDSGGGHRTRPPGAGRRPRRRRGKHR